MGNTVLEGTKLKASYEKVQKSAYSKPGCSPELLKAMALEALDVAQEKGHFPFHIQLANHSDTPCTILSNGKVAGLLDPTEGMTFTGLGVDLLLTKPMGNVDAKLDYAYSFGAKALRNIVKKYTEFDHTFPHPNNPGKCYHFNFKNTTPDLSVVVLTLTDKFTDPVRTLREKTQKEGEPDETGDLGDSESSEGEESD